MGDATKQQTNTQQESVIKKQVIAQYLQGVSREKIAESNGIGAGTVSNIIEECKSGIEGSDYESVRVTHSLLH